MNSVQREVGEVGFAVGEGGLNGSLQEFGSGKLGVLQVGLGDEGKAQQLQQVGLTAGKAKDFFHDELSRVLI